MSVIQLAELVKSFGQKRTDESLDDFRYVGFNRTILSLVKLVKRILYPEEKFF